MRFLYSSVFCLVILLSVLEEGSAREFREVVRLLASTGGNDSGVAASAVEKGNSSRNVLADQR